MKIKFDGNMTVEQFGELLAKTIQDFLKETDVKINEVELYNPIVQTAFKVSGVEEPQYLTTEHGEMLQVSVEVENGEIVSNEHNVDKADGDSRLQPKTAKKQKRVPTKEIQSMYENDDDLVLQKEFNINKNLKQKVFKDTKTNSLVIRYYNIRRNILIAEEIADNK